MTITRDRVLALRPCRPFLNWYEGNEETDALKLLLQVNDVSPSWATWGFTHAMNKNQCVRIAIYCAELVINIYEEWDGATDDPRKAIGLAKAWLNNPSCAARRAASAATDSARAATDSADTAYAADCAAYAAAYSSSCASRAISRVISLAADYAIDAARAADCAASASAIDAGCVASYAAIKETQEKIIREAVRILEEGE